VIFDPAGLPRLPLSVGVNVVQQMCTGHRQSCICRDVSSKPTAIAIPMISSHLKVTSRMFTFASAAKLEHVSQLDLQDETTFVLETSHHGRLFEAT
jgi:hypothetical protein